MKKTKVLFKTMCILLMLISFSTLFSFYQKPVPVYAQYAQQDTVPVLRLSGGDRYETAAAISREGWKTSEYIVLTTGEGDDKFADALAGSPISYALKAPLLLTTTNILNKSALDEITRLNAKKAVLLGGAGVVCEGIEQQLTSLGIAVERLWGPDRYATAVKIAEKIRTIKPFSKVFLTTGDEFQYAMMIAPYASKNNIPILFSEKGYLNLDVADALKRWKIKEVDIIGNTGIISVPVEDSLKSMGLKVNRVSGSNISQTNINTINMYKMGANLIGVARDDIFADGLAGASFAAIKDMAIILTGQNFADPSISQFLYSCNLRNSYVFGGSGAVSDYIITIIRKGTPEPAISGNTTGNINSGGLAATNNDWIYYHNAREGGKLYKIKNDGTKRAEVCSDTPMNINVIGEWIYYTNLNDNSKIYKIRIDGTCRTKLNDDESWNAYVIDNWIYYTSISDKGSLYKISTDGALRTKLNNNNSKYLSVQWDWIYYVNADDERTIYRMKTDDPSTIQQLKNVHVWDMNIADGYVYFSNEHDDRNLYKINTDGTGLTKLCIDIACDIQVIGDWIYYSDASTGDRLYKIMTDGTGKTLIYDGSAYLVNVVGDWIYFSHDKAGEVFYKVKTDGTGLSVVE